MKNIYALLLPLQINRDMSQVCPRIHTFNMYNVVSKNAHMTNLGLYMCISQRIDSEVIY